MKPVIVKLLHELIQYLCILAVLFLLTLFIPAESYLGLAVFMLMLASAVRVILTVIQITYRGAVCLLQNLRSMR